MPGLAAHGFAVLHFRRQFSLGAVPAHFPVQVSADNRFRLYVNGRFAGLGPALGNPFRWRFENYDLARFLHSGKNVISAEVWNFGEQAAERQMTMRTGFLLAGSGVAAVASTGTRRWQVALEPGIRLLPDSASMARLHTYYVAGPGELLEGRSLDWGWRQPGNQGAWQPATVIEPAASRLQNEPGTWMLEADPLPAMEFAAASAGALVRSEGLPGGPPPLVQGTVNGLRIPAQARVALLLRTPALQTAYPDLRISGGAGATIRLTYAEALVNSHGQKGNRNEITGKHIFGVYDEVIADGGAHRDYMPLEWRTWRYLQLDIRTGAQPLTIDALRAFRTGYPFRQKASFSSDAAWLKPMWTVSWRTARLCAHTTYMDCPYYERLQYVGDTRIQALITYAMTGDARLPRQAIQALHDSLLPDGITSSRYPSRKLQIIPTFSLMWVGMVRDYWNYTGDAAFTRQQLQVTRSVMDWYLARQNANGLMGKLPWWAFVDWTSGYKDGVPPQDAQGDSAAITLQFAQALGDAAGLEQRLGNAERAREYLAARRRALSAVWRLCWDPGKRLIADTPQHATYSQEANALAVWLDAVPRAQQRGLMRRLLWPELGGARPGAELSPAGYYFRFYVARALDHAGMGADYLRLLGPWKQALAMGLTTWPETDPASTRSDCHAWSAHPAYDLLTTVAGIRPGAPGFARVLLMPHLGNLKRVNAAMPTPHGLVQVRYRREGARLMVEAVLPAGVTGTLRWRGARVALRAGEQSVRLGGR